MESKKINQLATELAPVLSDLTIIGDPTTGISKKITLSQMASLFTGTVEEYANLASFPLVGVADTIYIALDTNVLYRWNTGTNAYVELSPNIINSLVFSDANGFDGTISLVGSVATLTITTALTTGSVGFIGASGALLEDNANFFWNNSTKRLGINTNAPTTAIDTFGSGIITRVNGTSTNNAFIGFASAGTNKWSVGNVQSDHRFRIYNEATTSELVSVLQTGEFGIGIANPTTKLHIDGGSSALIANLDANVSVAKSISFRSDNSNRINLEVSGTESGSNAGANFFIRRYSDAGALLDTPLTITRSTGLISLATDLSVTTATFSGITTISNATASTSITTGALVITGGVGISGSLFGTTGIFSGSLSTTAGNAISAGGGTLTITPSSTRGVVNAGGSVDQFFTLAANGYLQGSSSLVRLLSVPDLDFVVGGTQRLLISASTGAATFFSNLTTNGTFIGRTTNGQAFGVGNGVDSDLGIFVQTGNIAFSNTGASSGFTFAIGGSTRLTIASTGAATFSNSIRTTNIGIGFAAQSNIGAFVYRNAADFALVVQQDGSGIPLQVSSGGIIRMIVGNNGNVLIGNSTDYGLKFQVSGVIASVNNTIGAYASSNATTYGWFNSGIGTLLLTNSGVANVGLFNMATGVYTATSDINKKKDFELSTIGLNEVLKLKPTLYRMKSDNTEGEKELGFIAQEVKELIPQAYVESQDFIGINFNPIIAALTKAIQDQQKQIEELKEKLA